MKRLARWATAAMFAVVLAVPLGAQPGQASAAASPAPAAPAAALPDLSPTLSQVEQASQATIDAIGHLQIDHWKVNTDGKREAMHNAQSVVRNLNSALPGLIAAARSAPNSVAASFKLYHNLNALYDVMSSLTESAGAFGSESDFRALGQQLKAFDEARDTLATRIEQQSTQQDTEVARLRDSLKAATTQAQTPPPPSKKIVVENGNVPAATKKKKSSTPAKTAPASKPPAGTTPPGN